MSARKKPATTAPAPDGAGGPPETVRVRVSVKAGGPERRFRAGLAFGREPVVVEVTPEQAAALKADAMLAVAEAGGD